jgi:hypothetical protein
MRPAAAAPAAIAAEVTPAIAETVKKQVEAGIDCIGDGEFWTARSLAHYTAHFTGIEARPVAPGEPPTSRQSTRERDEFADFYADCDRAGTLFLVPGEKPMPPVLRKDAIFVHPLNLALSCTFPRVPALSCVITRRWG